MRIAIAMALVALLGSAPLLACNGKVKTVTMTETLACSELSDDYAEEYRDCREVRRETTVVTETDGGCHGAVSCSLGAVGGLIALPFRIVGVVLDAVF